MRTKRLSSSQLRLINLMQDVRYGVIEDLSFKGGQPVFEPEPRVLWDIKLGAKRDKTKVFPDEELKAPVVELLNSLTKFDSGTIRRLEVQRGLPFRLQVERRRGA